MLWLMVGNNSSCRRSSRPLVSNLWSALEKEALTVQPDQLPPSIRRRGSSVQGLRSCSAVTAVLLWSERQRSACKENLCGSRTERLKTCSSLRSGLWFTLEDNVASTTSTFLCFFFSTENFLTEIQCVTQCEVRSIKVILLVWFVKIPDSLKLIFTPLAGHHLAAEVS